MGAGVRVTPEAVRRLYARRAYERAVEQRPVRLVEHEPGFVTGYDDSGRSEAWDPDDYDVATGRVAVARWTG